MRLAEVVADVWQGAIPTIHRLAEPTRRGLTVKRSMSVALEPVNPVSFFFMGLGGSLVSQ